MLNTSAVGLSVKQTYTYTQRDVILYNLSVGAGADDLKYVYEKGLKALPTFGVIPARLRITPSRSANRRICQRNSWEN